jgi:hypothetical protein
LDDRNDRCRCRLDRRGTWSRSASAPWPFLHEKHNSIALIRIQATKLILDVNACLPAQIDEILALDVQLSRQGINTGFLLQAELLYSDLPQSPVNRTLKLQYNLF